MLKDLIQRSLLGYWLDLNRAIYAYLNGWVVQMIKLKSVEVQACVLSFQMICVSQQKCDT